ncbi:5-hydroxytryptamine receptor 3A-like [Hyla sarda]|uniref:5-hydroxytryptamine receptor 3A-like n=1 Tax=Hyla sarda TaxID=327740 RepID=UPI0024C32799|nr:5-hydroxytryptamine receptor 3A-like [Hyla sarda]
MYQLQQPQCDLCGSRSMSKDVPGKDYPGAKKTAQENNLTLKSAHGRLIAHLMNGYNKGVRPVQDWRKPINVYIDLQIYAILLVDEKQQSFTTYIWYEQSWKDEFLTWDPEKFDNVTRVSIPTQWIWQPDITVVELLEAGKPAEVSYVYINYNGIVQNNMPFQMKSSCNFDIYYFPFDHHNCTFTFSSWIHTAQDVNVSFRRHESKTFTSIYKDDGEWEIVNVTPVYRLYVVDLEENVDTFGETLFHIIIKRNPLFYTVNLILPSVLLMVMNMAAFYLPPESGERTSFKITLLLGYSVFLIIVADHAPASGTPLLGSHFVMCMVLLVISVMESIFIVNIVHRHNLHQPVPKWVKTLVLEKMTTWLFIKDENHFITSRNVVSDKPEQKESSSTEKLANYIDENIKCLDSQFTITKDPEVLLRILKEILSILEDQRMTTEQAFFIEWLHIGYVIDALLFRLYVIVVLAYTISLAVIWAQWLDA